MHATISGTHGSPAPGDEARGGEGHLDHLVTAVYEELRRIARRHLRSERAGLSLQPTALVHEAYLRLASKKGVTWGGRTHVIAAAAGEMRRILVDHARARCALKRRAPHLVVTSLEECADARDLAIDVIALDEALAALAALSSRQARVVEMRLFGGLLVEEVAEVLGVSARTVKGDWRAGRAWLSRRLHGGAS